MTRCDYCDEPTKNRPVACYFDAVNPTDATLLVLCDACSQPRDTGIDYAAPFADEEE